MNRKVSNVPACRISKLVSSNIFSLFPCFHEFIYKAMSVYADVSVGFSTKNYVEFNIFGSNAFLLSLEWNAESLNIFTGKTPVLCRSGRVVRASNLGSKDPETSIPL